MVRIIILVSVMFIGIHTKAQVDSLNCDKHFKYYDSLFGENLIVIWETPPSIKQCSQRSINALRKLVKKHSGSEYVLVNMIIDSKGTPICFRFKHGFKQKIKAIIIRELKKLDFNPAQRKGKGVESIYMLKL